MYQLIDTFNDRIISRHRTLLAAVKADKVFGRAVKRHNGQNSYIPTAILDPDGVNIQPDHPEYEKMMSMDYELQGL